MSLEASMRQRIRELGINTESHAQTVDAIIGAADATGIRPGLTSNEDECLEARWTLDDSQIVLSVTLETDEVSDEVTVYVYERRWSTFAFNEQRSDSDDGLTKLLTDIITSYTPSPVK